MRLKPLALFLVFAIAFSGCTFFKLVRSSKLKQPHFEYVRCDLLSASDRSASLQITLTAQNPNEIGLKNVFVDYELFSEGKRFLKGSNLALQLSPKGLTQLLVPAEVIYSDLLQAVGPVVGQLLMDRKSIPIRIDAVVYGKPTVYNEVEQGSLFEFSWKVSRTEQVPVPQEEKDRLKKKVGKALKKLF